MIITIQLDTVDPPPDEAALLAVLTNAPAAEPEGFEQVRGSRAKLRALVDEIEQVAEDALTVRTNPDADRAAWRRALGTIFELCRDGEVPDDDPIA